MEPPVLLSPLLKVGEPDVSGDQTQDLLNLRQWCSHYTNTVIWDNLRLM